jgi:hypothetical protein
VADKGTPFLLGDSITVAESGGEGREVALVLSMVE